MQHMQGGEIHVAPIHDIDGTRFGEQHVERMNIVKFAVGYADEARDVAAQIEQRVHLHRCFGRTKMRPREHRQAQIDGRRVQTVLDRSTPRSSPA